MKVSLVKDQSKLSGIIAKRCLHGECKERCVKMLTFLGKPQEITEVFGEKVYHASDGKNYIGGCVHHLPYLKLLGHVLINCDDITQKIFNSIINTTIDEINVINDVYVSCSHVRRLLTLSNEKKGVSKNDIIDMIYKIVHYYFETTMCEIPGEMTAYVNILNSNFLVKHEEEAIILFITLKKAFSELKFPLKYSVTHENIIGIDLSLLTIIQSSKLVSKLCECLSEKKTL